MLGDLTSASGLKVSQTERNLPAAVTDIGCEREINEDRYAVIRCPSGEAWVVCDGMGGTLGGELAAQLAIDAVRRRLESSEAGPAEAVLVSAVEEANRVILLRRQNPAFSGMGTTIVALLVSKSEVVITHAGDSRAYLIRDGNIQQLTTDHTYVQDLVDRGAIKQHEALSHPQAHVLTRCLGAEPQLKLDTQKYWIWDSAKGETEDRLLLCSDGLYSLVDDDEVAEIASSYSPQEACVRLIDLAKGRGGYDNITVTILPLGGQLREEEPPQKEKTAAKQVSKKVAPKRKRRELTKEVALSLAFISFVVAVAITTLVIYVTKFSEG